MNLWGGLNRYLFLFFQFLPDLPTFKFTFQETNDLLGGVAISVLLADSRIEPGLAQISLIYGYRIAYGVMDAS